MLEASTQATSANSTVVLLVLNFSVTNILLGTECTNTAVVVDDRYDPALRDALQQLGASVDACPEQLDRSQLPSDV